MSLAAALDETKFIESIGINLIIGKASAFVESASLVTALGVTKFIEMIGVNLKT